MSAPFRRLPLLATFGLLIGAAQAQPAPLPAVGQAAASRVASTPGYDFHSDFWLNLHDYLYGVVGGGPGDAALPEEGTDCLAALPAEQAAPWNEALAFYRDAMAERHHRRDPLVRTLRYRLSGLVPGEPEAEFEALMDLLRGAAPAYRACLWDAHDARNRARVDELVALLERHARPIQQALAEAYRSPWPEAVRADVVSFSNYAGASTASGPGLPPHTMFSSTDPDTGGLSGLELLLHEASHAMFGPRHGAVSEAFHAAADAQQRPMPSGLWHAVSFYTSGEAVREAAAEAGLTYEPYALRVGLFERAFEGYLDPLRQHWQPYLDGAVSLEEAALGVIGAIPSSEGSEG
ncbi:MAG: hypothetical protein R3362_04375 [Rhodothermales bacterium]|nr:hypothetical protein [Rhodothermales bacterium]